MTHLVGKMTHLNYLWNKNLNARKINLKKVFKFFLQKVLEIIHLRKNLFTERFETR